MMSIERKANNKNQKQWQIKGVVHSKIGNILYVHFKYIMI